jgi:hypothetical protein
VAAASLEDWFAINNVFIRYATALDHGDVDGVVDCFNPNATISSPVLGDYVGHEGVRAFAQRTARLLREQGVQFRHVVGNLRVDVDGDSARALCYLLDFVTRDGETELLSPGEYDCRLTRRAGQWRFDRRVVAMDRHFAVKDI